MWYCCGVIWRAVERQHTADEFSRSPALAPDARLFPPLQNLFTASLSKCWALGHLLPATCQLPLFPGPSNSQGAPAPASTPSAQNCPPVRLCGSRGGPPLTTCDSTKEKWTKINLRHSSPLRKFISILFQRVCGKGEVEKTGEKWSDTSYIQLPSIGMVLDSQEISNIVQGVPVVQT